MPNPSGSERTYSSLQTLHLSAAQNGFFESMSQLLCTPGTNFYVVAVLAWLAVQCLMFEIVLFTCFSCFILTKISLFSEWFFPCGMTQASDPVKNYLL